MEYNGSAIIAMAGKDCVAIASDLRLGVNKQQTVAHNFQKVFEINPTLYIGLAGLATDVHTISSLLKFRTDLYKLNEEREMSPKVLTAVMSSILYSKRFGPYYIEPVIAGLDPVTGAPFISSMDLIGASVSVPDFLVSGTCTGNMYGMCEALYKPDLPPDELFETVAQALRAAVDRDALAGWGGVVHVITKEGVRTRELKGRMD